MMQPIARVVSRAGEVFDDFAYRTALSQVRVSVGGRPTDAERNCFNGLEKLGFREELTKAGEELLVLSDVFLDRLLEPLSMLLCRIALKIT